MAKEILASYDFKGVGQIIGALYEPRPDDPSSPSAGQGWFNTVLKRWRMNDGTVSFSMLRTDGDDVYTGVLTFNPGSQSRPFDVASGKTDVVTNLNSDRVDSFHASQSVTVSTVAVRDASGRLSVADPTSAEHAATKAYVDSVAAGQDRKAPCRVATTTTLPSYTHSSGILTATANGAFPTTDGITVAINERVLVKDESGANEKYNGIFTLTTVGDASNPWVLTRATDADVDAEVTSGMTTFILEGSANAGFGYTLITPDPITLGTTALEFVVSSSSTSYSPGNGIVFDGATIHFGKSTAYSIGDIPYCGSSSAISFLGAGTSGYVLKAQGAGAAPIFGQVNIASEITGILPTGNGGTGTSTTFTAGSVVFAGGAGVYAQDNAGISFNSSTDRLTVGLLTISNIPSGGTGNVVMVSESGVTKTRTIDSRVWGSTLLDGAGSAGHVAFWSDTDTLTLDSGQLFWDATNNRLGVGTTTPTTTLDVVSAASNVIRLYRNNVNASLQTQNSVSSAYWGINTSGNACIGFSTDQTSAPLQVTSAGNIGIGTAAPSKKLTVVGASLFRGTGANMQFDTGAASDGRFEFLYDGGREALMTVNADSFNIVGDTNTVLKLYTGAFTTQLVLGTDGGITFGSIGSGTSDSVLIEVAGAVKKRTINTGVWTGNTIWNSGNDGAASGLDADLLDGQQGSYYLDLFNATGDTDDVDEGLSNLYFTNARARSALAGTADRITYTSATGVIDIASTYVGQATITTIGTITTGTWNATAIGSAYGGTGITTYTVGDLIYCSATNTLAKRGIGPNGNFFRVSGGLPVWSTADTDAITEGSNLYFTNARARSALSSAGATEIAYNSGTGVIGLGSQAGLVKTFSVGDGVSLEYTLTHNFGTRYVGACTRRDSGNYDEVEVESECLTDNTTKIRFTQAPSTNQFKVILFAAHG